MVPSEFPEVQPYDAVKQLMRVQVDMQFHDLRSLLRLPLPDQGIVGGCNLTTATLLCNIIAGASVLFWDSSVAAVTEQGTSGERFRTLMAKHYPWSDLDAKRDREGAHVLWKYTRNPLAHSLGVGKTVRLAGGAPADDAPVILSKEKHGLPEADVQELVGSPVLPHRFLPLRTIEHNSPGFYVIRVEVFAWGVHRMLRNLFADEPEMRAAEDTAQQILPRLTGAGFSGP